MESFFGKIIDLHNYFKDLQFIRHESEELTLDLKKIQSLLYDYNILDIHKKNLEDLDTQLRIVLKNRFFFQLMKIEMKLETL